MYASDFDSFDKNYYLYQHPLTTQPARTIVWDCDATWGNQWTGLPENPLTALWGSMFQVGLPFLFIVAGDGFSQAIFTVPEYIQSYILNQKCLLETGILSNVSIKARGNYLYGK